MLARASALVIVLTCLGGNLGHASMITYQGTATFTTVGSQQLFLPRFDPTLGDLTSITVSIYGTGREAFVCVVDDTYPFWDQEGHPYRPIMTPHLDHAFSVLGPGLSSVNDLDWSGESHEMIGSWFWPTADWYHGAVGWGEALVDSTQSYEFAAYTGSGSVPFTISATTMQASFIQDPRMTDAQHQAYVASGRISEGFVRPSLTVRINVDYQYEPEAVPEPTSLALAGGGLLGLYWRVRRRRLAP